MIFLIKASFEKEHTKLEPQGLYFNIPYFSGEKDLHSSFSSIKTWPLYHQRKFCSDDISVGCVKRPQLTKALQQLLMTLGDQYNLILVDWQEHFFIQNRVVSQRKYLDIRKNKKSLPGFVKQIRKSQVIPDKNFSWNSILRTPPLTTILHFTFVLL